MRHSPPRAAAPRGACRGGAKPELQAVGAAHDLLEHQGIPHGGYVVPDVGVCRLTRY